MRTPIATTQTLECPPRSIEDGVDAQRIRALLCERLAALQGVITGAARDLVESDTTAGDFADVAQRIDAANLNAGVLDVGTMGLEETVWAIQRIDAGTYGICDRCRQLIPPVRLQALPDAQHCIGCQREIDSERRASLDPEDEDGE